MYRTIQKRTGCKFKPGTPVSLNSHYMDRSSNKEYLYMLFFSNKFIALHECCKIFFFKHTSWSFLPYSKNLTNTSTNFRVCSSSWTETMTFISQYNLPISIKVHPYYCPYQYLLQFILKSEFYSIAWITTFNFSMYQLMNIWLVFIVFFFCLDNASINNHIYTFVWACI